MRGTDPKHKVVCWSAYIDMGLRRDRDMTDEEIREHTRRDLIYGKKAGAQLVRTQHAIGSENFRAMLPFCKQLDIQLCIEMHAPHHPDVPVWQEYLKICAEPESEGYLGVVPDFSIFQYAPHKQMIDIYLQHGFRKDKLEQVVELNKQRLTAEEILASDEYTPYESQAIRDIVEHYQSPAKLEDLKRLIPYAPYIHGKFHYPDENCHNPCIPYEAIFPMVKELGFKGYIVSEYEGWDEAAIKQLRRLEKQGLLQSEWEMGEAKPRKYYHRTEEGYRIYRELKEQWNIISENMKGLLEE